MNEKLLRALKMWAKSSYTRYDRMVLTELLNVMIREYDDVEEREEIQRKVDEAKIKLSNGISFRQVRKDFGL